MDEKQKRILEINRDTTLSSGEKLKLIQQIMTAHVIIPTFDQTSCAHYKKTCGNFHFVCCDKIYQCCRCHNENSECASPIQIDIIECLKCNKKQEPSNVCIECGEKFSRSYCGLCYIWTMKDAYHCDECGLCRVGIKENYFHCVNCNMCFKNPTNDNANNHTCVTKIISDSKCGFCAENVHNSQEHSMQLKCGHSSHRACFIKALENNNYKCPICRKSMIDMSAHWNMMRIEIILHPLPDEIKKNVTIICYDCGSTTNDTAFHFIGMECSSCHSFNTSSK